VGTSAWPGNAVELTHGPLWRHRLDSPFADVRSPLAEFPVVTAHSDPSVLAEFPVVTAHSDPSVL